MRNVLTLCTAVFLLAGLAACSGPYTTDPAQTFAYSRGDGQRFDPTREDYGTRQGR